MKSTLIVIAVLATTYSLAAATESTPQGGLRGTMPCRIEDGEDCLGLQNGEGRGKRPCKEGEDCLGLKYGDGRGGRLCKEGGDCTRSKDGEGNGDGPCKEGEDCPRLRDGDGQGRGGGGPRDQERNGDGNGEGYKHRGDGDGRGDGPCQQGEDCPRMSDVHDREGGEGWKQRGDGTGEGRGRGGGDWMMGEQQRGGNWWAGDETVPEDACVDPCECELPHGMAIGVLVIDVENEAGDPYCFRPHRAKYLIDNAGFLCYSKCDN